MGHGQGAPGGGGLTLTRIALASALLAAHLRRLEDLSKSRARYQLLVENDVPSVRISQRPFGTAPWVSVGDNDAAPSPSSA